jgi:hypothetical protein
MRPEKSRQRLQTSCLTMCRQRPGCRHLQRVLIGRTKSIDSGPNWELLAFEPELAPEAYIEALLCQVDCLACECGCLTVKQLLRGDCCSIQRHRRLHAWQECRFPRTGPESSLRTKANVVRCTNTEPNGAPCLLLSNCFHPDAAYLRVGVGKKCAR